MAQLNTRGTLTRTRWDYFEHSNGVASVWGNVTSGVIGAFFANNSTGATAIDIYTMNWSASVANLFVVSLIAPPIVQTPLTPAESHIFALTGETAQPPGVIGMYTASIGPAYTFFRYSATSSGAQFAPIMGSYFATLPPGWGITIGTVGGPNPCELSMTVWYQYVTDNIAPAP